MIIGHGGNIRDLAKKLDCTADDIIDMSSNLNPLGPPETIETVIWDNRVKIQSLPEPEAMTMRKGFARFHDIDPDRVVAGNGTTWFIYTLPKALGSKKALIAGPTYSDYRDACLMHGIPFEHCIAQAQELFRPDTDAISRMARAADLVFICNPNNPTGSLIAREKLDHLVKKHQDTVFIIDESYLPFVDGANDISMVSETRYDNLIVLSSMSKIFRIPGLRTGFLTTNPAMVEKIMKYYQPWSVNALAQVVIEHIFQHPERIEPFYEKTRAYIKKEKQVFLEQLENVQGLELLDSCTYFILACLTGKKTSAEFCEQIGQQKILVRDCSNFSGLSDQYVRFSLKKRAINDRLADLIKKVMKND